MEIAFDQLLSIVKTLPPKQLNQLKAEIEKESINNQSVDLETLLKIEELSTNGEQSSVS